MFISEEYVETVEYFVGYNHGKNCKIDFRGRIAMQQENITKKKRKHEAGAVVIEATLSLTAFMFFIVTILSIVNLCILQQKIGLAVNGAAKEIAQYSYIYSLSGVNHIQQGNYESAAMARDDIGTVVTGISDMYKGISDFAEGDASFQDASAQLTGSLETIEDTITEAAGEGSAWVMSFLRMVGNEAAEEAKGRICGAIAKGLIQKNLVSCSDGSADAFLKSKGVEQGIDGIDFSDSVFMLNGSNDIILVADYKVRVITLLNHDITLHFRQAAVTRAWEASPLESGMADSDGEAPEETETLTPEEIRQKMIEEYGEAAILEIEKYMDTSEFTEDDWRYQLSLYANADIYEIDGIPVINGMVEGKMPVEEYVEARIASVKQGTQGDEDHLFVLGTYNTSPNYIEFAEKHGANYFDMGSEWNRIQEEYGFTDDDMFRLFNAPILDEAIQAGNTIVYAHNPEEASHNSALYKEWEYLKKKYGYTELVKDRDGDFWYPK